MILMFSTLVLTLVSSCPSGKRWQRRWQRWQWRWQQRWQRRWQRRWQQRWQQQWQRWQQLWAQLGESCSPLKAEVQPGPRRSLRRRQPPRSSRMLASLWPRSWAPRPLHPTFPAPAGGVPYTHPLGPHKGCPACCQLTGLPCLPLHAGGVLSLPSHPLLCQCPLGRSDKRRGGGRRKERGGHGKTGHLLGKLPGEQGQACRTRGEGTFVELWCR